jgi:hypothetical protein
LTEVAADLLDASGDAIPVQRLQQIKCLQNHQRKGSLLNILFPLHPASLINVIWFIDWGMLILCCKATGMTFVRSG